jgi:hypothetical protein
MLLPGRRLGGVRHGDTSCVCRRGVLPLARNLDAVCHRCHSIELFPGHQLHIGQLLHD